MPLPNSYSEAVRLGQSRYFTGVPCKFGHLAERRTSNQACTECERVKSAAWKSANPEKRQASNIASKRKQYASLTAEQREAGNEYRRKWREQNRDRVRQYSKQWRDKNLDRAREAERAWAKENAEKKAAKDARRRASELNATPRWLTNGHHRSIEAIYSAARTLTEKTGIQHEVDHVVPLRGKLVCGLHVPWNLQVISRAANRRKSNKHD